MQKRICKAGCRQRRGGRILESWRNGTDGRSVERKRSGPSTEPWGTPVLTEEEGERMELITTDIERLVR